MKATQVIFLKANKWLTIVNFDKHGDSTFDKPNDALSAPHTQEKMSTTNIWYL